MLVRISRQDLHSENISNKQKIVKLAKLNVLTWFVITETTSYKMNEIQPEEVVNSDDEEKDPAPEVKKIRSYTDIMKFKLDK